MPLDSGFLSSPEMEGREPVAAACDQRSILGVAVNVMSRDEAVEQINRRLHHRHHGKYSFLNAHAANLAYVDDEFRELLAGFDVLADGVGVDIGSDILYGQKFPDNLNGTDFVPAILRRAEKNLRVGLLGARRGVAEQAASNLRTRYPKHSFDVVCHGYFDDAEQALIVEQLKADPPDILLVAMGNPWQEMWIARHCTHETCTLVFGVGALFDFMADRVPRAPLWARRFRLEWLYRLYLEPRRMWRRYIIGNPSFLYRTLKQKYSRPPKCQPGE